jgi:hypothetical protein
VVLGLPSPVHLVLPALHGEPREITHRYRAARSGIGDRSLMGPKDIATRGHLPHDGRSLRSGAC